MSNIKICDHCKRTVRGIELRTFGHFTPRGFGVFLGTSEFHNRPDLHFELCESCAREFAEWLGDAKRWMP